MTFKVDVKYKEDRVVKHTALSAEEVNLISVDTLIVTSQSYQIRRFHNLQSLTVDGVKWLEDK